MKCESWDTGDRRPDTDRATDGVCAPELGEGGRKSEGGGRKETGKGERRGGGSQERWELEEEEEGQCHHHNNTRLYLYLKRKDAEFVTKSRKKITESKSNHENHVSIKSSSVQHGPDTGSKSITRSALKRPAGLIQSSAAAAEKVRATLERS